MTTGDGQHTTTMNEASADDMKTISLLDDDDDEVVNNDVVRMSDDNDKEINSNVVQLQEEISNSTLSISSSGDSWPFQEKEDDTTTSTTASMAPNNDELNQSEMANLDEVTVAAIDDNTLTEQTSTGVIVSSVSHSPKQQQHDINLITNAELSSTIITNSSDANSLQISNDTSSSSSSSQLLVEDKSNTTFSNSGNNNSTSKDEDDDESSIAAQMAAVAIAAQAATRSTESPSAAANYAKQISTSMVPTTNHSSSSFLSSANSSSLPYPTQSKLLPYVRVDAVYDEFYKMCFGTSTPTIMDDVSDCNYIDNTLMNTNNADTVRLQNALKDHSFFIPDISHGINDDLSNVPLDPPSDDNHHQNTDISNDSVTDNYIDANDSAQSLPISNNMEPPFPPNDEHGTGTNLHNQTTSEHNNPYPSSPKATSSLNPHVSTVKKQLAQGRNVNFLKHLLVLTSHNCIDPEGEEPSSPIKSRTTSTYTASNISPLITQQDKETAIAACSTIMSVLDEAEYVYDSLSHLLPSSSMQHQEKKGQERKQEQDGPPKQLIVHSNQMMQQSIDIGVISNNNERQDNSLNVHDKSKSYHENIHDNQNLGDDLIQEDGNNDDDDDDLSFGPEEAVETEVGEEEIIDSSNISSSSSSNNTSSSFLTSSSHSGTEQDMIIIPDLLPPCTSDDGDATAAFFRACASVSSPTTTNTTGTLHSSNPTMDVISSTPSSKLSTTTSSMTQKSISTTKSGDSSTTKTTETSRLSMGSSIISSVFGKKRNKEKGKRFSLTASFSSSPKNSTNTETDDRNNNTSSEDKLSSFGSVLSSSEPPPPNMLDDDNILNSQSSRSPGIDYHVVIYKELLGLTVENVLERTVVKTVLQDGAAKKAGAKVGSLIVKVGSTETVNLTHFETIDELRQSQRPLKLILRRISKDALRGAREEMGRLLRGNGFGTSCVDSNVQSSSSADEKQKGNKLEVFKVGADAFYETVARYWFEGTRKSLNHKNLSKKDESLAKIGVKLVWIISLLVIGLEREGMKGGSSSESISKSDRQCSSNSKHSSKDYLDASRSVSKILYDYVYQHFESDNKVKNSSQDDQTSVVNRKKSKVPTPNNAVPGASKRAAKQSGSTENGTNASKPSDIALLRIGDVLHRTRSFLADPDSPPAALLRAEVIALLCDILDIDTDMTLSEEEAASSVSGHKAAATGDLGSAGSLLKLIVLNCSMMRSYGCVKVRNEKTGQMEDLHNSHAGNRFLAVVHRLAASRSTSARVTACSLGPVLWSHLDFPHQLQLRGVITRALHDVDVVVRKSTATVLHEIAELVFDSRAVPWLVLMCKRAMTDPEPQLRAAAMTLTWHLAEHLPNAFLGDATKGSRSLRGLPPRSDPTFAEVYLLQCKLLPVATSLAEDRAGSVRLAVAAQCDRLASALGEHWYSVIIDLLQALLSDTDDKVRSEAALCIPRLIENVLLGTNNGSGPNMSVTVLESLLPVAIKLSKDRSRIVRVSLASAAGELLTLLVALKSFDEITANDGLASSPVKDIQSSNHIHIDDTLIPLLQTLLDDSDPEVTSAALRAVTNASRGNVREITSRKKEQQNSDEDTISLSSNALSHSSHQSHIPERKDPVFIPVLSENQVLRLLPTLSNLATSSKWRVRQSAVEIVPALLGCTHRLETRAEIAQLCMKLMEDTVDAVRMTAAECLCLGGVSGGATGEWLNAIVIPHIEACRDSADCKQRLLSLKMVEIIIANGAQTETGKMTGNVVMATAIEGQDTSVSLRRRVLEIAASLMTDKIANVRLNIGRIFGGIVHFLEEEDLQYIINVLTELLQNEVQKARGGDRDVLYFSRKAMKLANERLIECCTL